MVSTHENEWEINFTEKDSAEIQTQDFLNTSQMFLPLTHLDPTPGRGMEDKQIVVLRGWAELEHWLNQDT